MRLSRGFLFVLALGLVSALSVRAQEPPAPPPVKPGEETKTPPQPAPAPAPLQTPPAAGPGTPPGDGPRPQLPPGAVRQPRPNNPRAPQNPPPPSLGGRQLPPIGTKPPPPIETIDDPAVGLVIDGEKVDRAAYGEALIEEYGTSYIEPYVASFLLEKRAKELKVEVAAADLDAALEKIKRERIEKRYQGDEAKLKAALVQSGYTLEGWLAKRRRDLRKDLLSKAVVKADRDLSEPALRKEFDQRHGKGGVKRTGRAIFLSTQVWTSNLYSQADYEAEKPAIDAEAKKRAEAARLELAKGRDFAELARERSDDPMAAKGGDYGRHWRNRLGPEVDQKLSQLKPGETSEVLPTQIGPIVARATGVHQGFEMHARQILLSVRAIGAGDAHLRERRILEARANAETLTASIRAGRTTFEDAARAHSDHAKSKEKGGDLGTFMSGTLAPELEQALLALEDGAIAMPVVSNEGVHILQLVSKKRRPDLDLPLVSIMRFSTEFLKVKERKLAGVIEDRAKALAEELKTRIEAGESAAELATKYGEEAQGGPRDPARREGELTDPLKPGTPAEVDAAFHSLTKQGQVVIAKSERGYHVITLEKIETRDFESMRADIEKEVREREPTPPEMRAHREELRAKAKVQKGRM